MTGSLEGKTWGKTKCILMNPFCEAHHVNALRGGVCSKHSHLFKTNLFFVIRGKLLIRTWKNNLVDDIILTDGEYTSVKPNQLHLFEALEDTEFMEIYYPEGIKDDIKREIDGFMKPNET